MLDKTLAPIGLLGTKILALSDSGSVHSVNFSDCADNELLSSGQDQDIDYQLFGITVFPVIVTFKNPAITHRDFLFKIGSDIGIEESCLSAFVDNFEDSNTEERELVFSWLEKNGYDGAILPNDSIPVCANGDWELQVSYVSFHPESQVAFKASSPMTNQESFCNIDFHGYRYSFEDESITQARCQP